jgi:hypothetical protein
LESDGDIGCYAARVFAVSVDATSDEGPVVMAVSLGNSKQVYLIAHCFLSGFMAVRMFIGECGEIIEPIRRAAVSCLVASVQLGSLL